MSDRHEWIEAAAQALEDGGVNAVKVEALARTLDVTKGSFYWHFEDRPALLAAVLTRWEDGARAVLEAAASLNAPEQRLSALFRDMARPSSGLSDAEVFAWARHDRGVAERVAHVERARVVFVKEQLAELGVSLHDAHRRSEAAYLAAAAWLERDARTPWMKSDYGAFVDDVFKLLLRQPVGPASTVNPVR